MSLGRPRLRGGGECFHGCKLVRCAELDDGSPGKSDWQRICDAALGLVGLIVNRSCESLKCCLS